MPTSRRLILNAQGTLSNPNIALAAARAGTLGQLAHGPTARIDQRALTDARRSGLGAINVTLGYVAGPSDPRAVTLSELQDWDAFIGKHPAHLLKVLSAQDIELAVTRERIGVIFGFQNTAMLGDDASNVATFARMGVRTMQLTYNGRNQVADGCMVADDGGLSAFGSDVIGQMNAQRVLIDLSHSSDRTCADALSQSNASVAITHTGCRALSNTPRNASDATLRLLAQNGGVAGIYCMPFLRERGQPRAQDLIRHLEHAINVCGEDHVGLGSDGGTTAIDDLPTYLHYLAEAAAERKQSGTGAAGENDAVTLFLPDLCGPMQFNNLVDLLQARGHTSDRIDKILGRNFLRLMREIWGA